MVRMSNDFKKRISIGLVTGAVVGALIIGIGGRLAMRVIALMAGRQGGFSWGGTFDVITLGLLIGLFSGVVYGFVEKKGFSNYVLNGCLYGTLLFVVLLILPIDGKGAAKGFPEMQTEIYLIFALLLIIYGIGLASLFRRSVDRFL